MRLICVGSYRAGGLSFSPGEEIHVTDEDGERLLRDSPGSFALPEEKPEEGAAEAAKGLDRRARGGRVR